MLSPNEFGELLWRIARYVLLVVFGLGVVAGILTVKYLLGE